MNSTEKILRNNLKKVKQNISNLNNKKLINTILSASNLIIASLKNKKKIIFCGNGGSASDAQHLSAELLGKYLKNRKPLASLDLNSNTSAITAISNDIKFEEIFSRQLMALGRKGDILFAITTSGKSKNIIKAIKVAKIKGIKTILLGSNKAKKIKNFVDLLIPSPGNRVDRIQETQIIIGHLICEIVEKKLS